MSVKLSKLTSLIGLAGPINGKKFASGTVTSSVAGTSKGFIYADGTSGVSLPYVTVSGLSFKPTTIILISAGSGNQGVTLYTEMSDYYYSSGTAKLFTVNGSYGNFQNTNYKKDNTSMVTTMGSFTMPVGGNNVSYYWLAFE